VTTRESRSRSGIEWLRITYGNKYALRKVFGPELANELLALYSCCNEAAKEIGIHVALDDFVKILILSFHLKARGNEAFQLDDS